MKKLILFALLIPAGLLAQCTPASGYTHCRAISIDHTQVGGSDLSNFPVLVSATLGGSRVLNASCFDVVFTSDSAGSIRIPWEQESCNQSTGAVADWALAPSVSSTADTSIYVSYGNGGVSSAQNTGSLSPATMWTAAGYLAVYHMPDGSTLSANDSTGTYNGTLVNTPTATAGQIGGAALLSGSSSQITLPGALDPSGNRTLSFWYKAAPDVNNIDLLFYLGGPVSTNTDFILMQFGFGQNFYLYNGSNAAEATTSCPAGNWCHIALAKTTNSLDSFYLNAVSAATFVPSSHSAQSFGNIIGLFNTSDHTFDEVRLRSSESTAGWIAAEYNNQKAGSTFVTLGNEIPPSVGVHNPLLRGVLMR